MLSNIVKSILLESKEYRISSDPEFLLYDFYMLSYLSTTNINPQSKSYKGSFFGDDEEFRSLIEDAENKLLPALKKEMLEAVFWSICCELRHVWTQSDIGNRSELESLNLPQSFLDFLKSAELVYRDVDNSPLNRQQSYDIAVKSIKNSKHSWAQFVIGARTIFSKIIRWEVDYGGPAWENICLGWLRLYNSTKKEEIYVAIDHIYDLQHNNDSVFNKVSRYLKADPIWGSALPDVDLNAKWLANALQLKAGIKDIHVLTKYCSSDMKKLAKLVLKKINVSQKRDYSKIIDFGKFLADLNDVKLKFGDGKFLVTINDAPYKKNSVNICRIIFTVKLKNEKIERMLSEIYREFEIKISLDKNRNHFILKHEWTNIPAKIFDSQDELIEYLNIFAKDFFEKTYKKALISIGAEELI